MADFCRDCSIEMFGKDYRELADLCKPGHMVQVICEGCGFIWVDENGVKVELEEE
jgi:hypothetical protein